MITGELLGVKKGSSCRAASDTMFVNANTPDNTADHAAMFVWLTGSCPREALSFRAAVNKSRMYRSFQGNVNSASKFVLPLGSLLQLVMITPLPDHFCHTSNGWTGAFKYTVCHGVPRCTRPSQPTLASLFVGNSQSSDLLIMGSFKLRSYKVALELCPASVPDQGS